MNQAELRETLQQLKWTRYASALEGITLLTLLFVAMPLKYMGGYAIATSIVGPVHGAAFLLYIWMVSQSIHGVGWEKWEIALLFILATVPFGAVFNERRLKHKYGVLSETVTQNEKAPI